MCDGEQGGGGRGDCMWGVGEVMGGRGREKGRKVDSGYVVGEGEQEQRLERVEKWGGSEERWVCRWGRGGHQGGRKSGG